MCALCFQKHSQFVVSARSMIVLNVLTPTLVGIVLFVKYMRSDMR